MIHATGSLNALQLSIGGEPIATLNHTKGAFELNGQTYTVKRSGVLSPTYTLSNADGPVVSVKRASFVNRYSVPVGERTFMLNAEGLLARQFGLYHGETRVGGIVSTNRFRITQSIEIDLPDAVPLDVQVFLVWLLLQNWGDSSG